MSGMMPADRALSPWRCRAAVAAGAWAATVWIASLPMTEGRAAEGGTDPDGGRSAAIGEGGADRKEGDGERFLRERALETGRRSDAAPARGNGAAMEALPDPLRRAAAFASGIRNDADVKAGWMLATVEALLEAGHREAAAVLAERVPGYRRFIALARVGRAAARAGDGAVAGRTVAEATKGTRGFRHWQNSTVAVHAATAAAAAGRPDVVESMLAEISPEEPKMVVEARCRIAVEQAFRGESYVVPDGESVVEVIGLEDRRGDRIPRPDWLELARTVRDIAAIEFRRARAARPAIDAAGLLDPEAPAEAFAAGIRRSMGLATRSNIAQGPFLVETLEVVQDASESAAADLAGELASAAAAELSRLSDYADWKPGLMARLAPALRSLGRAAEVDALLGRAEELAGTLRPMDQPRVLAEVAAGHVAIGDEASAVRLWTEAARVAGRNSNGRIRAVGATAICLAVAGSRMETVPAELAAELDRIRSSL